MVKAVPYKNPFGVFYDVYVNDELEMTGATKDEAKEIYECVLYKNKMLASKNNEKGEINENL